MSRYRRTQQKQSIAGLRMVILIGALLIVVLSVFFTRGRFGNIMQSSPVYEGPEILSEYLPAINQGQTIHHRHFSLSYLEDFEQAQWVAYELSREELDAPRVPRHDRFNPDYNVTTRSAFYRDYSNSGYTRGHLASAADMGFDTLAMRESFYMSNISPQVRAFNNGIWRELEEQTRDWARYNGRLYIVTGPVLTDDLTTRIGQNRVVVPDFFYKVLMDPDEPEIKSIGFILPNARSEKPLLDYAVSIDSIEQLTGIDFFPLLKDVMDESAFDTAQWPVNMRRYQMRVKEWNNE